MGYQGLVTSLLKHTHVKLSEFPFNYYQYWQLGYQNLVTSVANKASKQNSADLELLWQI